MIDKNITSLTPAAQQACRAFLAACKAQGVNLIITETKRSQDRQNQLFGQGRTRTECAARGISPSYAKPEEKKVTWTLNSNHKSGQAWDIAVLKDGAIDWGYTAGFWKAGAIAKSLGITWGGDWVKPDMPHFEYKEAVFKMTNEDVAEAQLLAQACKRAGYIQDIVLWIGYFSGDYNCKSGNLRALVKNILDKEGKK